MEKILGNFEDLLNNQERYQLVRCSKKLEFLHINDDVNKASVIEVLDEDKTMITIKFLIDNIYKQEFVNLIISKGVNLADILFEFKNDNYSLENLFYLVMKILELDLDFVKNISFESNNLSLLYKNGRIIESTQMTVIDEKYTLSYRKKENSSIDAVKVFLYTNCVRLYKEWNNYGNNDSIVNAYYDKNKFLDPLATFNLDLNYPKEEKELSSMIIQYPITDTMTSSEFDPFVGYNPQYNKDMNEDCLQKVKKWKNNNEI